MSDSAVGAGSPFPTPERAGDGYEPLAPALRAARASIREIALEKLAATP